MKVHQLFCVLAFACTNAGCSWMYYTERNVLESPLRALDECRMQHRFRAWAKDSWQHVVKMNPDHHYSEDYVCGYLSGFVDYLDAGGNGEPPAMPPDRYFSSKYENPAGVNAIHDWFAGFRHGSSDAKASGLREFVELPISQPPRDSDNVAAPNATPATARLPGENAQTPATSAPANPPATAPTRPEDILPPPRPLPEVAPKILPQVQPMQFGVEETD